MSSYRQQYLDSARRRKSNIPLPSSQKLKLDLSQMSDISNDNNPPENSNDNTGTQQMITTDFQSGDNNLQKYDNNLQNQADDDFQNIKKSPSKSRIPIPSTSTPLSSKPPTYCNSNSMKTVNNNNSLLHKTTVADLESKLRLKEAETTRLDTELENAKNILSNKVKEIRESAKIVREIDSIKKENSQLANLTEELKNKNQDLSQQLEAEKKSKTLVEQRNARLETLLKTRPDKLVNTNKRDSSSGSSGSILKSVLLAVEHVVIVASISYAVYYKYVIEPEQERAAKSWWQ